MVTNRQYVYVCPRCRGGVDRMTDPERYWCRSCDLTYPVYFDIPDFRLKSDPYLTLEQEREKAARLHAFGQTHDFDTLVDEYYRITDDVLAPQAQRFAAYVRGGVARGEGILPKLMPRPDGPILDAGCGAGGFVAAAAAQGIDACGADIALRWLVIAAKRLDELGLRAELVCADIAAPPFPDGRFAAVAAVDLLEHVEDADRTLASLARVASANAPIYVAAANRYTLAPYPLAALWGVGYLPRSLRRRYVTARRGFDTLRHATLLSPGGLRQRLRRCGFKRIEVAALDVPAARRSGLGGFQKRILPLYSHLRRMPVLGRILVSVGPAFEITARGPSGPGTATFPARAQ